MTWSTAVQLVGGFLLLVAGAEGLVRGAARLAGLVGISPLVVGLTVVAFGTSAPELAVSVGGALAGATDLAVGNVVGSNVFNVLAVLGVSALAGGLVVQQRIVRLDVPLVIAATGFVWALGADGRIGRGEGVILVGAMLAYTGWSYVVGRRETPAVEAEYAEAFAVDVGAERRRWPLDVTFVIGGLVVLVVGAQLLVGAATDLAASLGVSQLVIGLTVVAAGTSLPELATSAVAALRGERDIAVGNVVGSNLLNLFGVLGVSALVAPEGLGVGRDLLVEGLPIALLVALVALPALATGLEVRPWEGALLVLGYAGYLTVIVLSGVGSPMADVARGVLMAGLAGMAVLIVVVGLRSTRPSP